MDIKAKFNKLADTWFDETSRFSSIGSIMSNASLKEILRIEKDDLIPLILNELKIRPYHWELVLIRITGQNPAGDLRDRERIVRAWETWYAESPKSS